MMGEKPVTASTVTVLGFRVTVMSANIEIKVI